MILQQLQDLLARLYDVPGKFAVTDFLFTDATHVSGPAPQSTAAADERVFLSQDADGLQIGVYVAAEVLERLTASNPLEALGDGNLRDYCTALEGVSHFHYLTWRAAGEHEVSLLELELQAEVDKYAAAILLLTAQRHGEFPRTLHERMFHCVGFDPHLDEQSLVRYRTANRFAARFCRHLDERFLRLRRARPAEWLRELRRFYRLGHAQKLRLAAA